jgi:hypothetical protein
MEMASPESVPIIFFSDDSDQLFNDSGEHRPPGIFNLLLQQDDSPQSQSQVAENKQTRI